MTINIVTKSIHNGHTGYVCILCLPDIQTDLLIFITITILSLYCYMYIQVHFDTLQQQKANVFIDD